MENNKFFKNYKGLYISELQRIYYKKSTLACFLSIPILLIASVKYYLSVNKVVSISNPMFTSFYNFPVAAMQEQLMLGLNLVVVFLIVLSVTQEFRNGSIRMVLIRSYKPTQVFLAKIVTIISAIFIYLVTYLVLSYIIGYLTLPKINEIAIFNWEPLLTGNQVFIYTLKYYSFAFLTLSTMAIVIFFIATISKSTIIASGVSLATLLLFIIYPFIIQIFFFDSENLKILQLISITQIQYEGIALSLGQNSIHLGFSLLVSLAYITVFFIGNYVIYNRCDNLI